MIGRHFTLSCSKFPRKCCNHSEIMIADYTVKGCHQFLFNDNNDDRIERCNLRFFFQSPHCAANRFQYVRSGGPGAIVCKSRATHRAHITCNMSCVVVRWGSSAIKFDRLEISFILALFHWYDWSTEVYLVVVAVVAAVVVVVVAVVVIKFKAQIEIFYSLLTAPPTVSNTYAQVERAQSCPNRIQHILRLSRATCRDISHAERRGSSGIKFYRVEIAFI